jgi:hypothetical protein
MIGAISPQFPKYVVPTITSIETILIPFLEMGREFHRHTKGAFKHSKEPPNPRSFKYTNESQLGG